MYMSGMIYYDESPRIDRKCPNNKDVQNHDFRSYTISMAKIYIAAKYLSLVFVQWVLYVNLQ